MVTYLYIFMIYKFSLKRKISSRVMRLWSPLFIQRRIFLSSFFLCLLWAISWTKFWSTSFYFSLRFLLSSFCWYRFIISHYMFVHKGIHVQFNYHLFDVLEWNACNLWGFKIFRAQQNICNGRILVEWTNVYLNSSNI